MSANTPLDLSEIDPPVWRVMVAGVAYGPYTLGQMRAFITEGRVGAATMIAEADGAAFEPASEKVQLATSFRDAVRTDIDEHASNYVVIARMNSGDIAINNALNELGKFGEAMPGVFLLRSSAKLARIRDRLMSLSGATDRIMIIDASNDRLAWLNLGPEADIHMRAVWAKAA